MRYNTYSNIVWQSLKEANQAAKTNIALFDQSDGHARNYIE